jgi:hypothetical protein
VWAVESAKEAEHQSPPHSFAAAVLIYWACNSLHAWLIACITPTHYIHLYRTSSAAVLIYWACSSLHAWLIACITPTHYIHFIQNICCCCAYILSVQFTTCMTHYMHNTHTLHPFHTEHPHVTFIACFTPASAHHRKHHTHTRHLPLAYHPHLAYIHGIHNTHACSMHCMWPHDSKLSCGKIVAGTQIVHTNGFCQSCTSVIHTHQHITQCCASFAHTWIYIGSG